MLNTVTKPMTKVRRRMLRAATVVLASVLMIGTVAAVPTEARDRVEAGQTHLSSARVKSAAGASPIVEF